MAPHREIPPSTEQMVHEIDQWLTGTPLGRQLADSGAIGGLANTMAVYFPDTDPRLLGDILLRLASCYASEPWMPTWMVVNLTGAAGAQLHERAAGKRASGGERP